MAKKELMSEDINDHALMTCVVKAQQQSPLTPLEIAELEALDVAQLIVDFGLSYHDAQTVINWANLESDRAVAQGVSFGVGNDEDFDTSLLGDAPGVGDGTVYPGLKESSRLTAHNLREMILLEASKFLMRK